MYNIVVTEMSRSMILMPSCASTQKILDPLQLLCLKIVKKNTYSIGTLLKYGSATKTGEKSSLYLFGCLYANFI